MEFVNTFLSLIFSNMSTYIIILLLVFLVYGLILKKHIYSLFDPFTIMIFSNVISTSVVIFMKYFNLCSNYQFAGYVLTESALLFGLITFKPIKLGVSETKEIEFKLIEKYFDENFYKMFFIIISFSFILLYMIFYYKYGIPLFQRGSRLDNIKNAGYVSSLSTGIKIFLTVMIIRNFSRYKLEKMRFNLFNVMVAISLILTILLSGSRSSIIGIIQFATLYFIFSSKKSFNPSTWRRINKVLLILTVVAVVTAMVLTSVRINIDYAGQVGKPSLLKYITIRIISFGDVYIYNYLPHVKYAGGTIANGLLLIFSPIILIIKSFLGIFGLHIINNFPQPIGLTMYQVVNKTLIIGGPNSRHNVFGIFYFGMFGGVVLSYIIGLTISLCRNHLFRKLKYTYSNLLLYTTLSYITINMISDISLAMAYLKYAFLVAIIFSTITYLVIKIIKVVKKDVHTSVH